MAKGELERAELSMIRGSVRLRYLADGPVEHTATWTLNVRLNTKTHARINENTKADSKTLAVAGECARCGYHRFSGVHVENVAVPKGVDRQGPPGSVETATGEMKCFGLSC